MAVIVGIVSRNLLSWRSSHGSLYGYHWRYDCKCIIGTCVHLRVWWISYGQKITTLLAIPKNPISPTQVVLQFWYDVDPGGDVSSHLSFFPIWLTVRQTKKEDVYSHSRQSISDSVMLYVRRAEAIWVWASKVPAECTLRQATQASPQVICLHELHTPRPAVALNSGRRLPCSIIICHANLLRRSMFPEL